MNTHANYSRRVKHAKRHIRERYNWHKKNPYMESKNGVKGYKLWNSVDRKIILGRDATFNESSMVKTSSFQQMERGKTKGYQSGWREMYFHCLQIVLYLSVSFRVSSVVT